MKMHDGEADIDARVVRRLVAAQFPRFRDLPVRAVRSTGTVNAIYRLGDRLCVRLPRMREWAGRPGEGVAVAPAARPALTLRVPEPVERGRPDEAYPFAWAIYDWIEGRPYADELVADEAGRRPISRGSCTSCARWRPATARRAAVAGRCATSTTVTRAAIAASDGSSTPGRRWPRGSARSTRRRGTGRRCGSTPTCSGRTCSSTAAACPRSSTSARWAPAIRPPTSLPAWSVFGAGGRAAYRAALAVDDGTWERARGYALHQAAMIIPYYAETNPDFVALAARTVEQVLADVRA